MDWQWKKINERITDLARSNKIPIIITISLVIHIISLKKCDKHENFAVKIQALEGLIIDKTKS